MEISYQKPNYLLHEIGNELHGDLVKKQNEIINENLRVPNKKPCEQSLPDRFDPIRDYNHIKGLDIEEQAKKKYTLHYLNIDSSMRNTQPYNVLGTTYYLEKNPISMNQNSDIITIKHYGHTFSSGDKITLAGFTTQVDSLSIYGNITNDIIISGQWTTEIIDGCLFTLFKDSQYMRINYTHHLLFDYDGLIPLFNYDITDLTVVLSGFVGNNALYYDNIPINVINTTHNIILADPFTGEIKRNVFFIKLPIVYNAIFVPPTTNYIIRITYNYLNGIPLKYLNADYPLDNSRSVGFHIVNSIAQNMYTIKITKPALATIKNIGGAIITVSFVEDTVLGDSFPNSYRVKLDYAYRNVQMIRMISAEFPDYGRSIRSSPISKKNNKFYWQNYIDGDHIYSVEIPPGNYVVSEIVTSLQILIYRTPRISHSINSSYTANHYVRFIVNYTTDIVEIRTYKESIVSYPIISVDPVLPDPTTEISTPVVYTLTIYHPNHNLLAGSIILINNAIDTLGIPASVINNQFTVDSVIDKDTYTIKLPYFNALTSRNNTKGGVNVNFYTPDIFRIRFDFADSVGTIFGFRDVGTFSAITKFGSSIKNSDPYDNEPLYDQNGNQKTITNDRVSLSFDNYILVTCNNISIIKYNGPIKNVFAKILLTNKGAYVYNSYVNTNKILDSPIPELSELFFNFYTPDGSLYNFNNLNHSFLLEIMT